MSEKRFLLGKGHELTEPIPYPRRHMDDKISPYSLSETFRRLTNDVKTSVLPYISKLPEQACPDEKATALFTIHPSYIAKSFYPDHLFDETHLFALGCRPRKITPQKIIRKQTPTKGNEELETVQYYISAKRDIFRQIAALTPNKMEQDWSSDFQKIECITPLYGEDRVHAMCLTDKQPEPLLEIILHSGNDDRYIVEKFQDYLDAIGLSPDIIHYPVSGLIYIPARIPKKKLTQLAEFSFLRTIRPMPKLRQIELGLPIRSISTHQQCKIPKSKARDQATKVAVFDTELPTEHALTPWVKHFPIKGKSTGHPHGLQVTSAALFGHIKDPNGLQTPPSNVCHHQVIIPEDEHDPDLYNVINRILGHLKEHHYEFANISVGPDFPIEDDTIHYWTAKLDDYLSDGETFLTIAAGNNGDLDYDSGNARVQIPSDAVNAISVGACNSLDDDWDRATYSAMGPGRSPGLIKPDVLHFGGDHDNLFHVVSQGKQPTLFCTGGTSFASPYVLHTALNIRSELGDQIGPLGLKALLINRAEQQAHHSQINAGWGRVPSDLNKLLLCEDGQARIVYEGTLRPGSFVRAPIPMPKGAIPGMVTITATFCFASEIDPTDSASYTRSGLEITFRPDIGKFGDDKSEHPKSETFFGAGQYSSEVERRKDGHKWDTVLHNSKKKRGSSLQDPVFDIHHNARERGHPTRKGKVIPYALVINIYAPRMVNIYDKIAQRYPILSPMTPVIEIPISVRP